ncbi:hypothetical protein [Pelagibius sp.]|uniref:hypothetical protein n=1 Tax=Pelagibius sp. TaxID=1931238 RepID=UPI00260FE224|nr:hypothetical protein [Pelagibius sp.]
MNRCLRLAAAAATGLEAQIEVRELKRSEGLLAAMPAALDTLAETQAELERAGDQTSYGKTQIFFERAKDLKAVADALNS